LVVATSNTATDLAVDRTRLAHDRTQLAWVRTAASLISFGFTIYKFFEYLHSKGETVEPRYFGPRKFALLLIGIGLVSLLLATIQNRREMRALRQHHEHVHNSLATLLESFLAVLGVIAFVAVALRQ